MTGTPRLVMIGARPHEPDLSVADSEYLGWRVELASADLGENQFVLELGDSCSEVPGVRNCLRR